MLETREHISIIIDEYGCLRGGVSMEDIIETMIGVEIVDEDDVAVDMQALAKEKTRMQLKKRNNSWKINRTNGMSVFGKTPNAD